MNSVTKRKFFIDFIEELRNTQEEFTMDFWKKYRMEKEKNSEYFVNYLKPKVKNYFVKKGIVERKSQNYPIQGTSADMTKLAGIYLFQFLEKNDLLFKILIPNVIHDEYIVETPERYKEEMKYQVKKCMEEAGKIFCKRVNISADPEESNKWIKA